MSYYIQGGELLHYGILGMKWGVRRYQNIDGSLTEAGKDHRAKYVAKEQKRLMKQYARYEKKYQRKADKAAKKGDLKTRDYWLNRKKDAIATRDNASKYVGNMEWNQIREDEARDVAGLKKAAKVGAIAGATALGGGGLAAGLASLSAAGMLSAPALERKAMQVMNTPQFQAGKQWLDLGLKGYLGARSYVIATSINTVMDQIDTSKIDRIGNSIGNSIENATTSAGRGLAKGITNSSSELGTSSDAVGRALGSAGANLLNSSAQSLMQNVDPSYVQAMSQGARYVQNYNDYANAGAQLGNQVGAGLGSAAASAINSAPNAATNSFKNSVDPRYANAARTGAEIIKKRRDG